MAQRPKKFLMRIPYHRDWKVEILRVTGDIDDEVVLNLPSQHSFEIRDRHGEICHPLRDPVLYSQFPMDVFLVEKGQNWDDINQPLAVIMCCKEIQLLGPSTVCH